MRIDEGLNLSSAKIGTRKFIIEIQKGVKTGEDACVVQDRPAS
jgi:hypothetical protein